MRKAIVGLMLAAVTLTAAEQSTKVITVKHRRSDSMAEVLSSGFHVVRFSRDFNTITITDTPERLKAAEAIIEQYDQPRRQAEFVLRVIEASSSAKGPTDAADLVPAELKSLLRYSSYGQRDMVVLRGQEAERHTIGLAGNLRGSLLFRVQDDAGAPSIESEINIAGPVRVGTEKAQYMTLLQTSAKLKSGETVVLGASKMLEGSGNALIILLTGKLLP